MQNENWNYDQVSDLFKQPFFELVSQAYAEHKKNFDPQDMELCTLLSIKTGACPEDCAYCPQSGHYKTGIEKEKLLDVEVVLEKAKVAKKNGAKRFCMGAAWKNPPKKEFQKVIAMVKAVKDMGLETCVTLGMLDNEQAHELKEAGLDYYNHNLDTSPDYYKKIVSTRSYEERLDTIKHLIDADINVCCGGILGMGETRADRINLLLELHKLPVAPKSIPINKLIATPGTPLANAKPISNLEFIRSVAVVRLMFPTSMIRLSAGREDMSDEFQSWCFMAGANSIFIGDKLLTAKNPHEKSDFHLLNELGIKTPHYLILQNEPA